MNVTETDKRSWIQVLCGMGTANDRRNGYIFLGWTYAWALTFVGANWFLRAEGEQSWMAVAGVIAIPTLVGLGAVWTYVRFLSAADELMRKIYLEALAIAFGGSVLFIFGYDLASAAGAPELSTDIAGVGMVAAWVAGQLIATWRYR